MSEGAIAEQRDLVGSREQTRRDEAEGDEWEEQDPYDGPRVVEEAHADHARSARIGHDVFYCDSLGDLASRRPDSSKNERLAAVSREYSQGLLGECLRSRT